MRVIEQKKYSIEVDKSDGKIYIYQDDVCRIEQECIEVEIEGAKQLIEVLKEFVDE